MTVWMVLTGICILIPLLFYGKLPKEIPIQWGGGVVRASAGKWVLFLYPAACVMIRFFLRPFILRWLSMRGMGGSRMAGYITNYLCFLALSIEIFTILYVYGIMKNIVLVLAADTILLGGILAAGGKAWRI